MVPGGWDVRNGPGRPGWGRHGWARPAGRFRERASGTVPNVGNRADRG